MVIASDIVILIFMVHVFASRPPDLKMVLMLLLKNTRNNQELK